MIKFTVYLLILIFFLSVSIAQSEQLQQPKISQLQTVIDVLEIETSARTIWELAYGYGDIENKPKSPKEVIEDIDVWLKNKPDKDEQKGQIAEYQLVVKHRDNLVRLFQEFKLVGTQLGEFVYLRGTIPVRFALKDNSLTLLITGVASEYTYNTLRTTAKSRAAKIIESMILPSLKNIHEFFSSSDIKYFGMVVVYSSKDFSKKSRVLKLKAEVVSLVIASDKCKQFVEGKITQEDLVDSADVYLFDRDMVTGIKKVKVSLE